MFVRVICTRKWKLAIGDIRNAVDEICSVCTVMTIGIDIIRNALDLNSRYQYSNNDGSGITTAFASGDYKDIRIDNALPVFSQCDKNFGYAVDRGNGNYFLQVCKGI